MKKKEAVRYAQVLLHRAEHQERCSSYMADVIIVGLGLDKSELSSEEKEVFRSAGTLAAHIIGKHGGIDFMFSEEGEFTGVVL